MALPDNVVWEARSATGSDDNGGGWVTGSSGIDFSQQDTPQYSVTDGVTNGTTTVTSATANFGTDVVGNLICIQGGTGAVVKDWYRIMSRTNSTTIVVDRSTGLTAGTGVTLSIGGAIATLVPPVAKAVPGNLIWAKGGITRTATLSLAAGGANPAANAVIRLKGYGTTRGDGEMFTITLSTNTGLKGISIDNYGWELSNITVDCANLGTSSGIVTTGNYRSFIHNCKVMNYTAVGIDVSQCNVTHCEVTGGGSGGTAGIRVDTCGVSHNWIHDNACTGIVLNDVTAPSSIVRNLITNNSGASSDGIRLGMAVNGDILNNTVFGSGRDGIRAAGGFNIILLIKGNLLTGNGGYGLNNTTAIFPAFSWDGNAYWSNTSGPRNGISSATGADAVGAYAYAANVDITGSDPTNDPFTDKANDNFTLNNIAGAGALLRGTNQTGFLVAPGTNFQDYGCYQHEDAGGGGGEGIGRLIGAGLVG